MSATRATETVLSGWGNFAKASALVYAPVTSDECRSLLGQQLIARGAGRSYGDSALSSTVISTAYLNQFISFDAQLGVLSAQAGVSLDEILQLSIPKGWFLSVTPGTAAVTLGGAIASDVHGKNHHQDGTFCNHIVSIELLTGDGEIVVCSPEIEPELFRATCGGMGLTGIIISATLRLMPIQSTMIKQTAIKATGFEDICEKLAEYCDYKYSVAWIDCLKQGKGLGRSILFLGEHAATGDLCYRKKEPNSVPFYGPSFLLSASLMRLFNEFYFGRFAAESESIIPLYRYFYPLDAINNWNRLYGRKGFIQYQFVLPEHQSREGLQLLFNKITESGLGSFLAVIKRFGPANSNLLTFPMHGFTISLDFKICSRLFTLLSTLDIEIAALGGRVYLTKDSVLSETIFKKMYVNWEHFQAVRERYGAMDRFSSLQSRRLGLS